MNFAELLRLGKGVFIGGSLVVISFFSLLVAVASVNEGPNQSLPTSAIALLVFITSLLGALWVTGFWGRWGLLIFFAIAPVLIVFDYSMNPLFPAGSILIAFVLASFRFRQGNDV